MSRQQENVIREKRTIEATKKNMMGPSGKLGQILMAFGTPIMRQGSGLVDAGFMSDPYEDLVHTEYSPTMSGQEGPVSYRDELLDMGNDNVYNEGLLFDGLSRGMHLDITYWHATNEIKVHYKGYQVYHEIAGELAGYAPFPEWENLIERLDRAAKDKVKKLKREQEEAIAERVQAKKRAFWQRLRTQWGI